MFHLLQQVDLLEVIHSGLAILELVEIYPLQCDQPLDGRLIMTILASLLCIIIDVACGGLLARLACLHCLSVEIN